MNGMLAYLGAALFEGIGVIQCLRLGSILVCVSYCGIWLHQLHHFIKAKRDACNNYIAPMNYSLSLLLPSLPAPNKQVKKHRLYLELLNIKPGSLGFIIMSLVFRVGTVQNCKVAGVKPGLELFLFLNLLLGSVSVTWHIAGEMERKAAT